MVSLRYASAPWCLSRDSAGWLDIGDLAHLAIDFPLVACGRDMGGGHRRVRYPLSGNMPLARVEAGRLSVSEGQIVLDSEHFFPLDGVLRCEGADSVMELACGSGVRRVREVRGRAEGYTQDGVLDRPVGVGRSGAAEDRQVRGSGWQGDQERHEDAAGQEVLRVLVDDAANVECKAGVRRSGHDSAGEAAGRGRGRKAARGQMVWRLVLVVLFYPRRGTSLQIRCTVARGMRGDSLASAHLIPKACFVRFTSC